jgi:hypothetical protein
MTCGAAGRWTTSCNRGSVSSATPRQSPWRSDGLKSTESQVASKAPSPKHQRAHALGRLHASRNQQDAYPCHVCCHMVLAQATWSHYVHVAIATSGLPHECCAAVQCWHSFALWPSRSQARLTGHGQWHHAHVVPWPQVRATSLWS